MNSERKRIIGLIGVLVVILGLIVWQASSQLRDGGDTKAYELTPPTEANGDSDPSIIDPAALDGPLVPDAEFVKLLEAARGDFQIVGGLRVSDRAGLVARMGSAERADRVIGALGADADNLAGASSKLLSVDVREYAETGSVVGLFASYTLAGQAPAYRSFSFAYAPDGSGGYRLDDVSESTGAEPVAGEED